MNLKMRPLVCFLMTLSLLFFTVQNIYAKPVSVEMWGGLNHEEVKVIQEIALLIQNKKYTEALDRAKDIKANENFYQPLVNIVLWNKYSGNIDKSVNFSDISRFVIDNEYFPNIKELRNNVEKLVVMKQVPASSYEKYFLTNPVKNKATKIYILNQKIEFLKNYSSSVANQQEELKKLQSLITEIWVKSDFSESEEKEFLEKYGSQLSEIDHIARINRLLWDGQFTTVMNTINLVSEDYQKLFLGIIKINENPKYINNIILSIPRNLRESEHLQYRRAIYYHMNEETDDMVDLLLDIPAQTEHPVKWWRLRHIYGRDLLKTKDYKESYKIISNHGLNVNDEDYPEAEWLSGWIALRFLNKPEDGARHFKNFYDNVSNPISISRGAYWLGMSYITMNKKEEAKKWYKIATQYPTYFYGQIAIHKYRNIDQLTLTNFVLPQDPEISVNDIKLVSQKMSVKVGYLLALMNDKKDALKILQNVMMDLNSRSKVAIIVKLIEELGDEDLNHRIYRFANRKNVFFIGKQYEIIDQIRDDPNAAIIHSLIKQESGFYQGAVSSAGAIGFMQIMPDTAKNVAKAMGIEYSQEKLAKDVDYNIKIGSYYIDSLLKKFDNSKILAIASYNAGPAKASKWIEEFYDPRDYGSAENYSNEDIDKVIDWIELITYSETRNYVQRVMENLLVYNYLLNDKNNSQ